MPIEVHCPHGHTAIEQIPTPEEGAVRVFTCQEDGYRLVLPK